MDYGHGYEHDGLVKIKDNEAVDDEQIWMWVTADNGAWYGPRLNWIQEHKVKFYKYVKKFDVVITAGGNCGMYARMHSKKFKHVYAFEPDPLNFHCMVNNTQTDNVVKIQCALGSKHKLIKMNIIDPDNVGCHQVNATSPDGFIPMLSLDAFNFPVVDLIQLDCEDYEHFIIEGAINTIARCKPIITAENGHYITDIMKIIGYKKIDQSHADSIFVPESFPQQEAVTLIVTD